MPSETFDQHGEPPLRDRAIAALISVASSARVREWAMRQGWGGRPVRQEQAQGILVAALGVLAAHSG